MTAPTENSARRFCFERDTFAFAHELVWKYHFDPVTGVMSTRKTDPPPTYYPLLTPGEVMQLPPTDELILVSGLLPIRAKNVRKKTAS